MSIWHKWLAHANPKNIGNMVRKNVVDGLDLVEVEKEFVCEDSVLLANRPDYPFKRAEYVRPNRES